jgi:glycosyltransferase involved in cell wall biosynthesis
MISNLKIITHINFAKGYRGGERQTQLLVEELSKKGYTQNIVLRKKSELYNRLNNVPNLTIYEISKPYIFNIFLFKNLEILHAHETKAAQIAYLVNILYKVPYIITRRVDNPIKNNFFNKAIYSNAKCSVVVSNAIKKEIVKVTNKANISRIFDAYSELPINAMEVMNIKNRFNGKFILGNIGELDNNHKGQYYLIEAMKKLQKTHPQIHLILLGKGKDLDNYKRQSSSLSNITFEGFINNVGDYIKGFDLFIYPSLHEGLGSILFDVMRLKVPIIASNVGGIPEIIENNKTGLLIEPRNKDFLYESIVKLYSNVVLKEELINNAFENIENYSIKSMSKQYEIIYNQ